MTKYTNNEQKSAITEGRVRTLKLLTCSLGEVDASAAWSYLKAAGYVEGITRKNFEAKLCAYGFGKRGKMIYDRGMIQNRKPRTVKLLPPEYNPGWMASPYTSVSKRIGETFHAN